MQRTPDAPFIDRNGVRKSWTEVQRQIRSLLRRRFPGPIDEVIIDEALADAVLDLVQYWQLLPSSQQDDGLNYGYALLRGTRKAATLIFGELARQRFLLSHAFGDGGDDDDDDTSPGEAPVTSAPLETAIDKMVFAQALRDSSHDEVVGEWDYEERARRVLEELPPVELEDWFANLLNPETEREQAEREGVNRNAVHERRVVRRGRAQQKARKYGLFV